MKKMWTSRTIISRSLKGIYICSDLESVTTMFFRIDLAIREFRRTIDELPNAIQHPIKHFNKRREQVSKIKLGKSDVVAQVQEFKVYQLVYL